MKGWLAKTLDRALPVDSSRALVQAFVLAGVAQAFKTYRLHSYVTAGFFLNLLAVLILTRVFAQRPTSPPAVVARGGRSTRWPRRLGWVLFLGGSAAALSFSRDLYVHWTENVMRALAGGPLALAAMAIGADLIAGFGFPARRPRMPTVRGGDSAVPLALILGLGFVFRFAGTGWFPPPDGFSSIEEMQRASGGLMILGGFRPWEFPLAQYMAAAGFALFGLSIHAVRLPVTALAWLTVPVFYLLARRLVDRPAALFATALLAVSRWHCQVGWYGEDVYVPLFPFVIVLYLLVRTRAEARPSLYVAAGALCGYLLYDYAAYRGALLLALLFVAVDALRQRRWPQDWRLILLMLAVAGFFATPLYALLQQDRGPSFYFEALERSFADQRYYTSDVASFLLLRLERIRMASDVFTYTDHLEFFSSLNLPFRPLLDPFTAVFFTLGFGTTALLSRRRRTYLFFAASFLLLAGGAMVLTWNLDFRRLAILIPFVFLLCAFLADEVEAQASRLDRRRLWHGVLVAVVVAAAVSNAIFLGRLARDRYVRAAHRTPYSIVLSHLQKGYDGRYVLLLSPEVNNFFEPNDYDWMKPPHLHGRIARGVEDLLDPQPPVPTSGSPLIVIARPYDIDTVMEQVTDVYRGATCVLQADPDSPRHDLGVCTLRGGRRAPGMKNPRREPR